MAMITSEYKNWIGELKQRIRQSQIKVAVRVNTELLQLYWQLGGEIVEKQQNAKWGDGFLKQLSADLMAEFPEMNGFSYRNIKYIRQWFSFYKEELTLCQQGVGFHGFENGKQPVSQLDDDITFPNLRNNNTKQLVSQMEKGNQQQADSHFEFENGINGGLTDE